MEKNIFGEEMQEEDKIVLSYSGPSFEKGSMNIRLLYTELQSLEKVVRDTVDLLISTGKIDPSFKEMELLIEIEKGSIREILTIVFSKPRAAQMIGTILTSFFAITYTHFLNKDSTPPPEYIEEIQHILNTPAYRGHLKNILAPVNLEKDVFLIQNNSGTINITIGSEEKEEISSNLEDDYGEESVLEKNGEYEEKLIGIIRKLDLDSPSGYLGFTVKNGQAKVPTTIEGEFHLNDIKEIINVELAVQARVQYKNGEMKRIQIVNYEIIEPHTDKISFIDQEDG